MTINSQYIIIVGCGRLGAYLANDLSRSKDNSIVVIDKKTEAFDRLAPSFSGFRMEADALEADVLVQAKINKADVVVTTTNHDNVNIMVAQMAKRIFNVKKVVARLTDPNKEKIYQELGIDTISPTALSADEFSRIIMKRACCE